MNPKIKKSKFVSEKTLDIKEEKRTREYYFHAKDTYTRGNYSIDYLDIETILYY